MRKRPKTNPRRTGGRGALIILALLLAASGALRMGDGIGVAMALTDASDHAAAALDCPQPPLALAEALSAREAKLAAQDIAMKDRSAALALADQVIEIRLAKLAAAEASLNETLARADGAAEADLARLTEVYQTMKPKDAAALFSTMAPEFTSGFLGRMRPDSAAAILSGMTPESAYAVSALLAGRNANVPKN